MTEQDITELEQKLSRGKEILAELRQLRAAATVAGRKVAAYKARSNGSDLLPEPLLLRVIEAGIASLTAKLKQELESLDVRGGEPQPVNVGYETDAAPLDDIVLTQRCPCCRGTGLAKDCTFW